jgi:hypothetical protein
MATDKIEKKESQYFFANQASKTTVPPETNGDSKASSSESGTAFDPFQVSSDGNQLESSVNLNGVAELKQEQDKQEIGIWAARGLLLLVAAIWGTNFAVRAYIISLLFLLFCLG